MTSAHQQTGRIPVPTAGQRMMLARMHAGLTQGQMASRLGVSIATVQRSEGGVSNPRRTTLMAWSMATDVDLYWLETGNAPSPNGDGAARECAIRDLNPEPADKGRRAELPQVTQLDHYRWAADVARVARVGRAA